MKIVIFGANGGIGKEAVQQALDAGHTVTAVVRRPETIPFTHERLTVVKGDAMKPATLIEPVKGQDAVISSLGVTKNEPTTLYSEGVANILSAMRTAGVRRILCISASGIEPGVWWQRLFAKMVLWRVLKHMYTDLVRMEEVLKASGLDWTILRPPMLSDKPRTGRYKVAINEPLTSGMTLSRADTADFMLTHLADPKTYQATVELAY